MTKIKERIILPNPIYTIRVREKNNFINKLRDYEKHRKKKLNDRKGTRGINSALNKTKQ